jgi:hypothetical protein
LSDPTTVPAPITGLWRTGRKVGRTIYVMHGVLPSDDDELLGMMDTAQLARKAVVCVNSFMISEAAHKR